MEDTPIRGLEGVIATDTRICDLDGVNGVLAYCGYDVPEMVRKKVTFEEIIYLLWHGELPTRERLNGFDQALKAETRSLARNDARSQADSPRRAEDGCAQRRRGNPGAFRPRSGGYLYGGEPQKSAQAHHEDSHHRRGPAPLGGGPEAAQSPPGTRARGEFPLHDHRPSSR